MRWTRTTTTLLTVAALAISAAALTGATFEGKAKAAALAKRVARGKYLTTIMGCNDCHTPAALFGAPDFDRQMAGSDLGWQGPWGVSYASNLTPDIETGLGEWNEADILKALRTGMRPDGTTLLPPMPWQDFAALTDEDANAIVAFLRSLKPVNHQVPARVPPGQTATGSILVFPPPSAWDTPKAPPNPPAKEDKK